MITLTSGGVVIDVRVIPRASQAGNAWVRGGALVIRLHAAPVDGAANTELIHVLSKLFGVSRRAITIVSGERSRQKRVRVDGVSPEIAASRLKDLGSTS